MRNGRRSHGAERIESFSDAVFGFALTLLVVSLEVPRTFDQLMTVVQGFLPFAFTFATVAWIWYEHHAFFKQFGPDDRITITLNCALLFMVMFYVYPLKFLFTLILEQLTGSPSFARALGREGDGVRLMVIYGLGFIVVFATMALLHLNVWARRVSLQLSPLEEFEARTGVVYHFVTAAVGLVSIAIVLIGGDNVAAFSGMSYGLLGVVHSVLGFRYGKQREELRAAARAGESPPAPAASIPTE